MINVYANVARLFLRTTLQSIVLFLILLDIIYLMNKTFHSLGVLHWNFKFAFWLFLRCYYCQHSKHGHGQQDCAKCQVSLNIIQKILIITCIILGIRILSCSYYNLCYNAVAELVEMVYTCSAKKPPQKLFQRCPSEDWFISVSQKKLCPFYFS